MMLSFSRDDFSFPCWVKWAGAESTSKRTRGTTSDGQHCSLGGLVVCGVVASAGAQQGGKSKISVSYNAS